MAQKLKLNSPVGADPLILRWPIPTSEGKDGPEEILDTIRLVCEDYPELKVPLETRIVKDGDDVSSYDYEQTKAMCERYNKAIDSLRQLVKGLPRQKSVCRQASMKQLKHILQQCYNHSVKDPEKLNHYEPFSPEVYGETSFELVEQMIKYVKFSEHDYFIDLGSGVGQVVLQVSAATNCKFCYGVEKAEWPAEYAVGMEHEFQKWMKWYGKEHGEFKIEKGDFLHDSIKDKLSKATIVFVNNFAFGPVVDHELKQRFANCLKEGARIVSSKAFCPLNFRITARNLSDIGTIMQVEELSPLCGAVSWTGKPFAYYVHTIDRTLLEKYFQRMKHPSKRDEIEPRKDRKGRPLLSIKDKINGALSVVSDQKSGRRCRMKGLQRENQTASPLTAAKVLDFDSGSNSSFTNSGGAVTVDDNSIVYGPTTRRQWNEYVKRPQSQSGTENENDSSTADTTQEIKTKDQAKQLIQKKKRMKTVKRLNNGALGKRQLQVGKNKKEPLSPVKSKAAVKLRPRHKKPASLSGPKRVAAAAASSSSSSSATASIVSTTTSTISSNTVPHTNGTVLPPSLDSLNLLHAHTVMSTSGKDLAEKVSYNDRRMTETSNAYFKPTVQKQTVSMLEKEVGFLQMIEAMKQRFLSFLAFMQTPEYRAMLLLQIEQEKRKNATLKSQAESLERDISILQKDGVRLIKDRLREMGIKADTPRELISQAKDIMLRHHELKSQTASLGAQVNALQAEHHHKITAYRKALDRKNTMQHSGNGFCEHPYHVMDKDRADQQRFLANIDRLHAELQHLQSVNKPYVARPEIVSSLNMSLNSVLEDKGMAMPNGISGGLPVNSHAAREKLNMKEKYDALTTVLAMVKKEVTAALQNNSVTVLGGSAVKSDPEPVPEAQIDNVRQDTPDRTLTVSVDLKSSKPAWNVIDTNVKNSLCSNLQPFKASESAALEQGAKITQMPVSTHWNMEVRKDGAVTSSSPRILPPGMKIDIKKSPRLNGVNAALKARVTHPNHYTLLQNPDSFISQSCKTNGSYNPAHTFNLYTENEKSAAEDLISLKDSLSTPTVNIDPQISTHKKAPVSSAPAMEFMQSLTNGSKSTNKKHSSHDDKPAMSIPNRAHKGSSNSLSKDSSVSCAITPASSTPHVFAQTPVASFSLSGSSSSSNQFTGQSNQVLSTVSPRQTRNASSSVKIIAGPPKNGLVKHRNLDTSMSQRPAKIRTLETRNEVQSGVPQVLSPAFHAQPQQQQQQQQTHILQTPALGQASAANLTHVLKPDSGQYLSSQSFLNAHMSQTIVSSSNSAGSTSLPFVTIQSPHVMPTNQGSNGVQPSLLKNQQQKPLVISSKSSTVCNGTANNNNNNIISSSSSSSGGLLGVSPTLPSQGTLAQADFLGQTVKIMPPNGRDVKGCLRSPEPCSVVVSEFGEFVPVASPEALDRYGNLKLQERDEHRALQTDSDSESTSDVNVEVVQDNCFFRKNILCTRKQKECSFSARKCSSKQEKQLSEMSRLSQELDGCCSESTGRTVIHSAVPFSDLEHTTVKENQESTLCMKSNSDLSVLVKRETRLEKMARSISDGKNDSSKERRLITKAECRSVESEMVLKHLQNKCKPLEHSFGSDQPCKIKDQQSRGLVNDERILCEDLLIHKNHSSRKRKLSMRHDHGTHKKSSYFAHSTHRKTSAAKYEPEIKNKLLSVSKSHHSVDSQSDHPNSRRERERSSRLCQYEQRHLEKSKKSEGLHSLKYESVKDRGHGHKNRAISGRFSEESKLIESDISLAAEASGETSKTSMKYVNAKSQNSSGKPSRNSSSVQQDKCLKKSEKHRSVISMSHEKQFMRNGNHCYSDNKQVLTRKSYRKHSSSESPTHEFGRSFNSADTRRPSPSRERVSESEKLISSSKRCKYHFSTETAKHLYSLNQGHSRSDKRKSRSVTQRNQEKKSSHIRSSSGGEKKKNFTKSARNYSCKTRETSPGPPKLERAVSPPQNHQKPHTRAKLSSSNLMSDSYITSTEQCFRFCEYSDKKICDDHKRENKTQKGSIRTSECDSKSRESSLSPKPPSRSSSETKGSADLSKLRGRSKSDKKESVTEGVNNEKDFRISDKLGSIKAHEISTLKPEQLVKPEIKYEDCFTINGSSESRSNVESHGKLSAECSQNQEKSEKSRIVSGCSLNSKEVKKSKQKEENHEVCLMENSFPKYARNGGNLVKDDSERFVQAESDKVDHNIEPGLVTNLDSPFGLLTPKSMSQTFVLEEDKLADISGGESVGHEDSKLDLTRRQGDKMEYAVKDEHELEAELVNVLAHGAELFPFPPTPGKTPCSVSVPCSPLTEINTLLSEEPNERASHGADANSLIEVDISVRKGPQTPPGSPLFNHQSQSRSRSPSISSSSSRGSSCDSCRSSSSSSSVSDSSSDDAEKKRRHYKHHKTPPRKLFTLITPVSLGIGSPPKASMQYSPMPSPSINGFNYGVAIRLGMASTSAPGFGNHGGTSVLSPLSVSTQQSPGYQMVTSDSLRSPNGLVRSPVGGCLMRQHSHLPNTLPSPASSTVPPSSSQACATQKDKDTGHCCKMVNSGECGGDESGSNGPPQNDGEKFESLKPVKPESHATGLNTESSMHKSAVSSKLESCYKIFDSSDAVKDHNANNTSLTCSQPPHLQGAVIPVDCNQNVCQLPASCCSDSVRASTSDTNGGIKTVSFVSEPSSLSCKLKPHVKDVSETAASCSSQDSLVDMVIDKSTLQPASFSLYRPSSKFSVPNSCTEMSSFTGAVDSEQSDGHGHRPGSSNLPCPSQHQQAMRFHAPTVTNHTANRIPEGQQQVHLSQTKQQQSLVVQHLHQHLPSFHQATSPPPPQSYLHLNISRQVRPKNPLHSSHGSRHNPHQLHTYKDHHSGGSRRMGFGSRLTLCHFPSHWGPGSPQTYNGPYYQNGPSHMNRPRHTPPPGPPCFRDGSNLTDGIMDFPLHGTMAQPYGSGQLDHPTPPYCTSSGSAGLGRSVHQHYTHFYHNKHH